MCNDAKRDTTSAIQEVLDRHLDLSYFGFRIAEAAEFAEKRAYLFSDDGVRQVEKCLAYLGLVGMAEPIRGCRTQSSYGLKHEVEAWLTAAGQVGEDAYVGNGSFIVAALIAGFPTYRSDPGSSPNCTVGVSIEDIRAVRAGKDPREWRNTTAFVKWLFAQAGRSDPVGDLGLDCGRDFSFPRMGSITAVRSYLFRYGSHVQEAFEMARAEYRSLL